VQWRLDLDALDGLRRTLIERGEAPRRARPFGSLVPKLGSLALQALVERVAPFCEVLYLMMVADGTCDLAERDVLRGVATMLSGDQLPGAELDILLEQFEAGYLAEGIEARLESVTNWLAADRDDAEAAFTLAAVMAVADRRVDASEHRILEDLRELLGISPERAEELVSSAAAP
jgi:tellurite resistance protein